ELLRRIARLEPWGEFRHASREDLGGRRLWFYEIPRRDAARLERAETPWAVVAEDANTLRVAVVSADKPEGMPVDPVHLWVRPLSVKRARLRRVEEELDELAERRVRLARWIPAL